MNASLKYHKEYQELCGDRVKKVKEGGIPSEVQEGLGRIDFNILDNADTDRRVYHIIPFMHVHFIPCQVHTSQLLQIIQELTWRKAEI